MLLDGVHVVREALASGITLEHLLVDEQKAHSEEIAALLATVPRTIVVMVSGALFPDLSPVRQATGVVALARRPRRRLDDVLAGTRVLVLHDVQDPGNVGAAIRAAEAAGASGAIAAGASADPWGWKALRGAMGSAFRLPVVRERDTAAALRALRDAGFVLFAASARGEVPLDRARFAPRTAVIVGSEGAGLPEDITSTADVRVAIPMRPPVESLNVAVAAALIMYAARS